MHRAIAAVLALIAATVSCASSTEPTKAEPFKYQLVPTFVEMSAMAGLNEPQLFRSPATPLTGTIRSERCDDIVEKGAARVLTDMPGMVTASRLICEPDVISGGVALIDLVGDDLPDMILTRLGSHPLLYRNDTRAAGYVKFTDVSELAGFTMIASDTNGVAVGDIDNDGDLDVFFSTLNGDRSILMVNDGSGRFSEEAGVRGVAMQTGFQHFGMSATFGDYDGDGWLDLHATEWRLPYASPTNNPVHTLLLRNLGADGKPGVFEDVTVQAGVSLGRPNFPIVSFASLMHDFDQDGIVDLLIVSDFGFTKWFWGNGDGTFTERSPADRDQDENGMGVALGDINGDGRQEVFVTSVMNNPECRVGRLGVVDLAGDRTRQATLGLSGSRLYAIDAERNFTEMAALAGVREPHWGWGAAFGDFRNLGTNDLLAVGGHSRIPCYEQEVPKLWLNDGLGNFRDHAALAGVSAEVTAKAVALGDINGNGFLDAVVTRDHDTPLLYINQGGPGRSVRVRVLSEAGAPLSGVRVSATLRDGDEMELVRWSGPHGAFLAVSEPVVHIGVGSDLGIVHQIVVHFPGQEPEILRDVLAGTTVTVRAKSR